jgi:hypothetical protein
VRPDPLLQLRRIGLDPTENRGVVNPHAAVGEHQLEITIADREHQVPADRPEDYLRDELPSLEGPALLHRAGLMPSRHARLLSCRDRSKKLQQNPNWEMERVGADDIRAVLKEALGSAEDENNIAALRRILEHLDSGPLDTLHPSATKRVGTDKSKPGAR